MIERLLHFLRGRKKQKGLSDFFLYTNKLKQKRILEAAARAANREQQILIKQYEEMRVLQK